LLDMRGGRGRKVGPIEALVLLLVVLHEFLE